MGKSNYDKLTRDYLENKISEPEKNRLEFWMSLTKTKGDQELGKDEAEKIYQAIVNPKTTEKELRDLASEGGTRTLMWWTWRIAASLLVVALIGYYGWQQGFRDGAITEVASAGDTEKVILKDGSLVWLKGESNLVYYNKYEEGLRYSELKGEALFEIAKDASHPFIIQCGDVKLKVLGTSFSVRATNDRIELRVLTGKVNFSTSSNTSGIDVIPNEKVVYGGGNNIVKLSMIAEDAVDVTEDTQYAMSFKGAVLTDVLKRLEDKFDVKIVTENKAIASCLVTLDITDHSLDKSLEILSDVLNITWKQDGQTIIVSGNGC